MQITITTPDTFVPHQGEPIVGRRYELVDLESGSEKQNRAFHPLMIEYYRSGLWSYQGSGYDNGATLSEFKDMIKRKLGAGFEKFVYAEIVNGKPSIHEVRTFAEIPEHIRNDPDLKQLVRGRLKSWADYTKKERRETIDNLIAEMLAVGVNTKKFHEILDGMEAK